MAKRPEPKKRPGKDGKKRPAPPRPRGDYCFACDVGTHHPGVSKPGCTCPCASR